MTAAVSGSNQNLHQTAVGLSSPSNCARIVHILQEIIKKVANVVKRIFDVLRTILMLPVVGLDAVVYKSSVRLLNLRNSPELEKQIPSSHLVNAASLHLVNDPTDSYEWKKKLIESARQSLEIAGYCGGKPFLEFLDIIEKKLQENNEFKVRIITNVSTLNAKEREVIKRLEKTHPESFETIKASPVWGLFPKIVRHENHTKMIVADQKFVISGGSSHTNLLLKQGTVKSAGGAASFIANGARDLDLLGEGEIASIMKQQFDYLWLKWKKLKGKPAIPSLDSGKDLTTVAESDKIQIDLSGTGVISTSCNVVFSHPEEKKNSAMDAYIKAIDEAQETISISNMGFNHRRVIRALIRAIVRGVNVTVITNGDHAKSSSAGRALGAGNRVWYKKLFSAAKTKAKEGENPPGKIKIYEYAENDILLHSKSMVVDESVKDNKPTVIIGSYNLSRESYRCNDEQIITVHSSELAKQTLERFDFFVSQSEEILPKHTRTLKFRLSLIKGYVLNATLRNILN